MPITFKVDNVEVKPFNLPRKSDATTPTQHYLRWSELFREQKLTETATPIRETPWNADNIFAANNAFVTTIVQAYNQHHKLILRPDDVWLAIAIQFGLYVNGNAKELRNKFVAHKGKKTLTVRGGGDLTTADYEDLLSSEMVKQLKENVTDQELCDWILPAFSTTTLNDKVVGSVVLMASLKSYFSYKMELCCGVPEITLLGTAEDWALIHQRVEKLRTFPGKCVEWATMLETITGNMARTAAGDIPDGFWQTMCHYHSGGSGPSYLSGWLTAFCVFSDKGKWQGDTSSQSRWGQKINRHGYPIINFSDVPSGNISVPMIVDDNGTIHNTVLFAGHAIGTAVADDTIQPTLTWSIFDKKQDQ